MEELKQSIPIDDDRTKKIEANFNATKEVFDPNSETIFWMNVDNRPSENPVINISPALLRTVFFQVYQPAIIKALAESNHTSYRELARTGDAGVLAEKTTKAFFEQLIFPLAHELAHIYLKSQGNEPLVDCYAIAHLKSLQKSGKLDFKINSGILKNVWQQSLSGPEARYIGNITEDQKNEINVRVEEIKKWQETTYDANEFIAECCNTKMQEK